MRDRALGAVAQILDRDRTVADLFLAEQQRMTRPAAVRALELRLESAAAAIAFDAQSRVTQALGKLQALRLRLFAQQNEVAVRSKPEAHRPCKASSSASRSMPMAKPAAGVGFPPSCSTSPS